MMRKRHTHTHTKASLIPFPSLPFPSLDLNLFTCGRQTLARKFEQARADFFFFFLLLCYSLAGSLQMRS